MKKFKFETYIIVPVSVEVTADKIESAENYLTAVPNISVLSSRKISYNITGEPITIPTTPQVVELPTEITYYVEGVASVPVFTRIKATSLKEAKTKAIEDIGIVYEPSPEGREDLEEGYWVASSIDSLVQPLHFTEMKNTNA